MDTAQDRANILVVDDLPDKLLVYESILESLGQNVIAVSSGREALKQVLQREFAVILLDVNMPGMDGFETAELIRKRKKSGHTPIIFVTAYLDDVRAVQGYAHGAVDYILAPVPAEVLRAKVKVFVDLYRMNQQVKRQAEENVLLAEERAKRAAAEEANRTSAFLADAGTVLANSMDFEATLRGLARVAVPFVADLSLVCLADESSAPARTEWAWTEPGNGITTQSLNECPALPSCLAAALADVLKGGRPQMLGKLDLAALAAETGPSPLAQMLHAGPLDQAVASALVLPLSARGKTLGAMVLLVGTSGRRLGPRNLTLAEELAYRAGIALDNAVLLRNIQEADRRKDEFLAMLAHELRNPLAPICNAVQVFRYLGPTQPELQQARDVIERQVQHLSRLVDDLLDVSRITRGKIRLHLEPVDVATAIANGVETSRPLIDARRQQLYISLPPESLKVMADLARLSQVLANLLNNAAKYTEEEGRVWLTVTREGDDAVFRVRDTGMGIPADLLPRVFDLFTQADRTLERAQGGLGIGLTLVRRLVELHHGSVQAFSSGPGQGSEFVVRLPALAQEQPAEGHDPRAVPCHAAAGKYRVLVVDDNIDTAESLAMLIRYDGHDVRTAHDGLAALQASKAFRPQVVLLDIGLPKMDGFEVARRLRALPQGDQMLLAAITGYDKKEDQYRCEKAGFNQHLVKPVCYETLRQLFTYPQLRPDEETVCTPES